MRAVMLLALVGCAVSAPELAAPNPASPHAAAGRLAGPPPSLREHVVTYPDVPALRTTPEPEHHHMPGMPGTGKPGS